MDAVRKLLLAGLLVGIQMWHVPKAKCSRFTQYIRKLKPHTKFVVAFGRENLEIFCLGAILSPQAIMTLASCFGEPEVDDELNPYNEDYHERLRRKTGFSHLNKTGKKPRREGQSGDREGRGDENERSPSKVNLTSHAHEGDADEEEDLLDDFSYDDEGLQAIIPIRPFSLFRIDRVRRVFIRLTAQVSRMIHHPDYNKLEGADLWAYNVAIAFTDIPFDFMKKKTIRPIRIYIEGFGKYLKSLNEAMMNAEYCRVIGLVEYSDNGTYTPKDTDVELISHHVLLDYDDCTSEYCRSVLENATGSCAGIGYHLHRNPANPLPFVVNGSPLVCRGRLMSLIDMKSQCDVTKFSGEFPSPHTIRRFFSFLSSKRNITVVQFEQDPSWAKKYKPNCTIPSIPLPKWRINRGLQQVSSSVCFSALVLVTTIISL